ncbi:MAG: hypothetical protein IJK39_03005 [Bacteroidales bacterium]|nr:hypothetical protein [Bacteroidales bacterium]
MFWFCKKKVSGIKFLENATDIHCHLLVGVDDGMDSLSESFELLTQEATAGVKRVYFTPHSMGLEGAVVDREATPHRRHHHHSKSEDAEEQLIEEGEGGIVSSAVLIKRKENLYAESAKASAFAGEPEGGFSNAHLKERFEEYKKHYTGDVEIRLAAEYMMNKEFLAKVHDKDLLTYADGVHVLVETSYFAPPVEMTEILYSLALNGYKPIIAHPERYQYMSKKDYRTLKDKGYEFQLNFLALAGYYGDAVYERAIDLLDNNMYGFTGSDFHRLSTFQRATKHLKLNSKRTDKLLKLFENNSTI